ncbi:MAG TPA: GDYXXLXY domain-containing protein [Planctomycetaceae bacterium]|jgi:uncharacterized membrane-anchored protein|nr:GDYXXLXY domain-containing protein [Planctomycetaceae bacterium]
MFETTADQHAASAGFGQIVEWFKARERPLLAISAAAQILVLAGMIVMRSIPYFRGQTVLLRVQPVDPRDMFRGDYVILSYEFSRLPPGGIRDLPNPSTEPASFRNQPVYVSLVAEPDGVHYRAGAWSTTSPVDGLYLRGTVVGSNQAEFGIESYFVQEGRGHHYEEAIRNRRLSAEVTVAPDGQAAVRGLRIE